MFRNTGTNSAFLRLLFCLQTKQHGFANMEFNTFASKDVKSLPIQYGNELHKTFRPKFFFSFRHEEFADCLWDWHYWHGSFSSKKTLLNSPEIPLIISVN